MILDEPHVTELVDPDPDPAPAPTTGLRALRRTRTGLLQRNLAQRADLAGLVLEMARLGTFNHALVEARAREALATELQVASIDAALAGDVTAIAEVAEDPSARDVACATCAAPLPIEGNFCAFCGTARGAA